MQGPVASYRHQGRIVIDVDRLSFLPAVHIACCVHYLVLDPLRLKGLTNRFLDVFSLARVWVVDNVDWLLTVVDFANLGQLAIFLLHFLQILSTQITLAGVFVGAFLMLSKGSRRVGRLPMD